MKRWLVSLSFLCTGFGVFAQKTIKLVNLWEQPQVHVHFEGYRLSFKIKDINKTLLLLSATGDSSLGVTTNLDTNRVYDIELYRGLRTEYKSKLQPLMQNSVGPFLLLAGHAAITNTKRKHLKEIIADIRPVRKDDSCAYINFYDAKNNALLFSGIMPVSLYNMDLGID